MFIYDEWDANLYRSMLRRSWDMKRARGKSSPIVGGDQVADASLMGTFMGLYKQALIEDENPGEHLPSEAARRILTQVFQHPGWAELRKETVGDRFLSALGASSIMETVTEIIEEQNQEQREKQGKPRRSRSNRDIGSMDKIEQVEAAKEQAEEDAATIEMIEEIEANARTQKERNAAEAAKRQLTARKEMNEAKAAEAETQAEEAMQRLEKRLADPDISHTMQRQAEHLKDVKDSLDELVEAGVLDEDTEDLVDQDLDEMGGNWDGDDEDDGGYDGDEELDEDEINALFGGRKGGNWGKELEGMTAAAIQRVRAASEALKATRGLAEVAQEAGRIKAVFRSAMKPTPIAGNPGAVEGVSYGNKVNLMTSAGMAMLATPKARRAWRLGFVEESLPEREMWGPDLAGRGPIVLAVDCSSSMGGSKFFWAKALGIALLSIAKEQDRDFAWIAFNHEVAYQVIVPGGKADVSALVGIEQHGATGGTRFAPWMHAAVEIIGSRSAFAKADVICISDGEPGEQVMDDEAARRFVEDAERRATRYVKLYGYSQAWADGEIANARESYGLYQWWKEERDRLGFRVRGVFIADNHRGTPAGSEAALATLTSRIDQLRGGEGSTIPSWVQSQIQREESTKVAVQAEITAGFEVPSSPTVAQIQAAWDWHASQYTDIIGDTGEARDRRQGHIERQSNLTRVQGPARVMTATADTWSDVSQIADSEATEAVEAEIARMVE